jgi:glucan-binding YG repeat protein
MTSIDLGENKIMRWFYCVGTPLESLDISRNDHLMLAYKYGKWYDWDYCDYYYCYYTDYTVVPNSITYGMEFDKTQVFTGLVPNIETGWQEEDGVRYYYENFARKTGWLTLEEGTYYLDDKGVPVTGVKTIDGKKYIFSKDGIRYTGWYVKSGKTYYFGSDGAMVTGSQKIDSKWYYFSSKGVMYTGWLTKSGNTYYFDENGVRASGKKVIDGNTYYFNSKGVMQIGWLTKSGKTYYFNTNGTMQFGWKKIDKKWYRFDKKGVMITGWVREERDYNVNYYYMGEDGAMLVNTSIEINGIVYTFDKNGVCQSPVEGTGMDDPPTE